MVRRVITTVSLVVPETQKLVLNWPLTVYTTHDVGKILSSKERLL
jgi:hypothetical protein